MYICIYICIYMCVYIYMYIPTINIITITKWKIHSKINSILIGIKEKKFRNLVFQTNIHVTSNGHEQLPGLLWPSRFWPNLYSIGYYLRQRIDIGTTAHISTNNKPICLGSTYPTVIQLSSTTFPWESKECLRSEKEKADSLAMIIRIWGRLLSTPNGYHSHWVGWSTTPHQCRKK
jgi:hypothetical protein